MENTLYYGITDEFCDAMAEHLKLHLNVKNCKLKMSYNSMVYLGRSFVMLSELSDWRTQLIGLFDIWRELDNKWRISFLSHLSSCLFDDTVQPHSLVQHLIENHIVPVSYNCETLMMHSLLIFMTPEEPTIDEKDEQFQHSILKSLSTDFVNPLYLQTYLNRLEQNNWVALRYMIYLSDLYAQMPTKKAFEIMNNTYEPAKLSDQDKLVLDFSEQTDLNQLQQSTLDAEFLLSEQIIVKISSEEFQTHLLIQAVEVINKLPTVRKDIFYEGCLTAAQGEKEYSNYLLLTDRRLLKLGFDRTMLAQVFLILLSKLFAPQHDTVFSTVALSIFRQLLFECVKDKPPLTDLVTEKTLIKSNIFVLLRKLSRELVLKPDNWWEKVRLNEIV